MRAWSEGIRRSGRTIALVPTMGALHAGHLALVRAARRAADRVVVSIFVNPTQFGPGEDYLRYPRPFARDRAKLAALGVDAVFAPSAAAMYPAGFACRLEVTGPLVARLCAPRRPGHFSGVATVVVKLFGIVQPHAAVFGAKDAQQLAVIRRVTRDLGLPVRIVDHPIVREPDGLAMSSRNAYLSAADRAAAPVLYRALRAGRAALAAGERRPARILAAARRMLAAERRVRIQYLDLVNADTLEPVNSARGRLLLAVAAFVGPARLIDNLRVRVR